MSDIFISYRRDDCSASAGRLSDKLRAKFGHDTVFMDVDTIEPGVDAIEAIEKRVGSCDVLIALIGKGWLTAADDEGRPRLHDPEDFVAVEIATALKRNVRLIPILVDGARMPKSQELPETLAKLTRRQALELRHMSFHADSDRLIGALERALASAAPGKPPAASANRSPDSTPIGNPLKALAGTLSSTAPAPPPAVFTSRFGESPSRPTVAIDFGIANAVLATSEGAEAVIIPNDVEDDTTPCVAGFATTGEPTVGWVAKRQLLLQPDRTTARIKLLMGRRRGDGGEDPLGPGLRWDSNGHPRVDLAGKSYSPEAIAAMIFTRLKSAAESYLEKEARFAITVPAYCNAEQRRSIEEAAALAKLDFTGAIEEPLAVVHAYGFGARANETVAVFHFGGGSMDLAIVELHSGNAVLRSPGGYTFVGGQDIDAGVVTLMANAFRREHKIDLLRDKMALQRLVEAAEKAKIELSSVMETEINLPFITATRAGPFHLQEFKLKRQDLEQSAFEILQMTIVVCERALKAAGLKPSHINRVILSGGQTLMPAVQAAVGEFFGQQPLLEIDPLTVAAAGAAKLARLMPAHRAGA